MSDYQARVADQIFSLDNVICAAYSSDEVRDSVSRIRKAIATFLWFFLSKINAAAWNRQVGRPFEWANCGTVTTPSFPSVLYIRFTPWEGKPWSGWIVWWTIANARHARSRHYSTTLSKRDVSCEISNPVKRKTEVQEGGNTENERNPRNPA